MSERKKYLVAGSGISGIGAVKLLSKHDADITLYDGNADLNEADIREKLIGINDVKIVLGELTAQVIAQTDIMILSPGIPVDAPFVNKVREQGIPIWGEVELAYRFGKGRVIGITGTNGKTTTTALVGEIMKRQFDSVYVVGNIGTSYTSMVDRFDEETVAVAEISSFQLETIDTFHPLVTAVLNITPDHLNRHYTMENYTNVKMSITKNQTADEICVLNYEDPILKEEARKLNNKVLFFSSKQTLEYGIYLQNEKIVYAENGTVTPICGVNDMKLVGIHNVENVMAAIGMALTMQVPIDVIREAIAEFNAVEHRIEYVTTKQGVIYYNDSKGTNTDASIKAIEAMTRPTVLIAGGYDKGSEFDEWFDAFGGRVKHLLLLGATREKIAKTAIAHRFDNYTFVESLEEAVKTAAAITKDGDAVLLSPACASWDMFKSYEERGTLFKNYVNAL